MKFHPIAPSSTPCSHLGFVRALAVVAFAILVLAPFALAATQASFYVDPAGNDANTGTSTAQPFRTLERARQAVNAINDNMTGDIFVYLRGGTHWLSAPLVLGPSDSGTNGFYVYYKNHASETPTVSGGTNLTGGWVLHDATKNIYRKTGVTGAFRQLYVNNSRAIRARTPNKNNNDTLGAYYNVVATNSAAKTVKILNTQISNWAGLTSVEMVMNPHWYHYRGRISSFTTDATHAYVSFQSPEQNSIFLKGDAFWTTTPYFFENAYAFLDAAGEWFLDDAADTLYYKPRTGETMSTVSIVAPARDALVQVNGTSSTTKVRCVQFQGITFAHANWNGPTTNGSAMTQAARELIVADRPGAITAQYAAFLHFVSCTFKFHGGSAISWFRGVTDSNIFACSFSELAGNAIVIHDQGTRDPVAGDKCDMITVANNTFTRAGQDYSNGIPLVAYFAQRLRIEANTISYSPYMGMQIGGQSGVGLESGIKDNVIRHNHIHHVMQFRDDGGAIYTLAKQPGTFVFENFADTLIRTNLTGTYPCAGLYADNYSQFITWEHNATVNVTAATYEQTGVGAQNNVWLNNVTTADASIVPYAGTKTYTWPLRVEAETMTLTNYTVEAGAYYSNGSGLKATAGTTGLARKNFSGATGTYSVDIAYIAEDDGNAIHRLFVNNVQVASWNALATPTATGTQIRHKVVHGVAVTNGQEIRVEGVQVSGSHARVDYLEFYKR